MAWSRRCLPGMTVCTEKMWVWLLSSVFIEASHCSDMYLLGAAFGHLTHVSLLAGFPAPTYTHGLSSTLSSCASCAPRPPSEVWYFWEWDRPYPITPEKRRHKSYECWWLVIWGWAWTVLQKQNRTLCAEGLTVQQNQVQSSPGKCIDIHCSASPVFTFLGWYLYQTRWDVDAWISPGLSQQGNWCRMFCAMLWSSWDPARVRIISCFYFANQEMR